MNSTDIYMIFVLPYLVMSAQSRTKSAFDRSLAPFEIFSKHYNALDFNYEQQHMAFDSN